MGKAASTRTSKNGRARDASDIEERALRLFQSELPDQCIVNQEIQDKQHFDFTLHLRDGARPSGIQFGIQVKGIARSKGGRRVSKRFKREHLEYWIERSRLPVIIVIVDVEKAEACFIASRAWARTYGASWKERGSTTVHISRANRVSDHDRFLRALRDADLEQQRSAGQYAIGTYKDLDGRFAYELTHTASGENIVALQALQPVELKITATGGAAVSKVRQMLRTGQPQAFQRAELRFDGGPIFDHIQAESGDRAFDFQVVAERDCHLAILVEDASGNRARAIEGLRGKIESGLERGQFITASREAPLLAHGFFDLSSPSAGLRGRFNLTIDLKSWVGHRLPNLPGLEQILRFVEATSGARRTYLHFTIDGVVIDPPVQLDDDVAPRFYEQIYGALEPYRALRDAAAKLGVAPKLPDLARLPDKAFEQLETLLCLCRRGEIAALMKPLETDVALELVDGTERLVQDRLQDGRFLITERNPAELFGERSETYLLARHVGPFTLVDGYEPGVANGRICLKLRTVDGAQVVYRLQTFEEARQPVVLPPRPEPGD